MIRQKSEALGGPPGGKEDFCRWHVPCAYTPTDTGVIAFRIAGRRERAYGKGRRAPQVDG